MINGLKGLQKVSFTKEVISTISFTWVTSVLFQFLFAEIAVCMLLHDIYIKKIFFEELQRKTGFLLVFGMDLFSLI